MSAKRKYEVNQIIRMTNIEIRVARQAYLEKQKAISYLFDLWNHTRSRNALSALILIAESDVPPDLR